MTREQFTNYLLNKGYTQDRWGHLHKTLTHAQLRMRYKLNKTSFTYQYKEPGDKEWRRMRVPGFKSSTVYFSWVGVGVDGLLCNISSKSPR